MYDGVGNGAAPCSNHVSFSHKHPSVCNAGYYFLQSLHTWTILNSEIWEYLVYLSNNQVFSDRPDEITDLSYSDSIYFTHSNNL